MITLEKMIDHTLLKPDACAADMENLCREAVKYGFYAVCVNPVWVGPCTYFLKNTGIKVVSVAGFPLGANSGTIKELEAEKALIDGADEVDMVIAVGKLLSGDWGWVEEEIRAVRRKTGGRVLKVIAETCYLNGDQKERVVKLAADCGADFIKTSTGFGPSGAAAEDVALFSRLEGGRIKIKASGGIRGCETAMAMINAGASRIGTSSGPKIMAEYRAGARG